MSIENALNEFSTAATKLAAAMENYASVIDKYSGLVVSAAGGTTSLDKTAAAATAATPAAEKGKPGRKPNAAKAAAAAAAAADDGFGDDEGEAADTPLTADDVKKILLKIRDANGGDKTPAIAIIKKHGYNAIPEVQEKDYRAIHDEAEAWLEANAD